MANGFDIKKVERGIREMQRELPIKVGNMALNWFKGSFRRQGFTDKGFRRWKKRTPSAPRNKGRAILTDTGTLKNSLRITKRTLRQVTISTRVPYADIHNEGGVISGNQSVRAHERKYTKGRLKGRTVKVKSFNRDVNTTIPQRKFMGDSEQLQRRITKLVVKSIDKALGF